MKKLRFAFLLAIFLFGGCHTEGTETIETTAAPEIEAIEEIEEAAASESDFLYKIINGKVTVNQYIGGESVVVIPETIEDCPVWKVKSDFLKDSHVTEVIYPANFTVFGGLSNCPDLKVIRFSSSPEQITDPFSLCEGLTEVDIPDGGAYRTIDGIVYTADGKTLVAYPRGRTGSFTVPADVEAIGSKAFYGSELSEIVLSDSVQTIGNYAFSETEKLTEVTIPAAVRTIGDYAFSESGIEQVTFSEGLEEVGFLAFKGTKITELYLPDSLVKSSSSIAEPGVLISASYPIEGLKPLLLHENLEFRDETTLQEAFRMAEEQFFEEKYPMGYIFMDLSGDRFPELLAVNGNYMRLYYFDEEWRESQPDIDWWGSVLWFETYHLCYSEETDTYIYYSEPYEYYPWWGMGDEPPLASQDYICITDDGITTGSLSENEIKDLTQAEILQTVDFPQMLEDWDVHFDDSYEKFVFVTDSFAEEPNGELQQKPLKIYGKQAEAYPYFDRYYPKEMQLSVAGVDVLHGGELAGVSFDHGVLTFENTVIDSSGHDCTIRASGFDEVVIELIGENKIVSDSACSLINGTRNSENLSIVFKGNGSLTTPFVNVEGISLTENVKITVDQKISPPGYLGLGVKDFTVYWMSISGEASLECRDIDVWSSMMLGDRASVNARYVKADSVKLTNDARLSINAGSFSSLSLSDDSEMKAVIDISDCDSYHTVEDMLIVGWRLQVSGNARLFADNSRHKNDAISLRDRGADLTISDHGSIEIKGNSAGRGIGITYLGTLTLNGDGKLKVDGGGGGASVCAGRIVLNGGTLELNAADGKPAIEIHQSRYSRADYESGYFIIGEVLSENITDRKIVDYTLWGSGKLVSNYFIQVREREQTSE